MPSPPWTPRPRVSAALLEAVRSTSVVVLDGLPRSGRSTAVGAVVDVLPGPVRWVGASAGDGAEVTAPRTVVVDDAHRLPADVLTRLVRRATDRDDVRLVLLGRGSLALPRERLLAEGRLADLSALLPWRPCEVDALLLAAGVALAPRSVDRLARGTGGWTGPLVHAVRRLAEEQEPEAAVERVLRAAQTMTDELLVTTPEGATVLAAWEQVASGAACRPAVVAAGLRAGLVVERDGQEVVRPEALAVVGGRRSPAAWSAAAERAVAEQRWVDALVAAGRLPSEDPVRRQVGQAVTRGLTGSVGPEDAVRLLDLPGDLVRQSPWSRLGLARALAAQGDLVQAVQEYDALLASGALPAPVLQRARAERDGMSFLAGGEWSLLPAWLRLLREALQGDPRSVATTALTQDEPTARFLAQVAQLLADGQGTLGRLPGELGLFLSSLAVLVDSAHRTMTGHPGSPAVLHAVADRSARRGHAWTARAAVTVADLADGTRPPSGWWAASSAARQDRWGECLARLLDGLTWCRCGDRHAGARELHISATLADAIGAPVLGLWARVLARTLGQDPSSSPVELLTTAEALQVPGAVRLLSALRDAPAPRAPRLERRREVSVAPDATAPPPAVDLLCLGTPALRLAGEPLRAGVLKPRHRALLHLLGARAGERVHRDELVDALWPDTPAVAGLRSLQVAVSAVRQVLAQADQASALHREAEAYELVVGPGLRIDVRDFVASGEAGLSAARRGDREQARRSLQEAVALYRGDLLVGERPAEWLVRRRDELRVQVIAATRVLSELLLAAGEHDAATAAAERGLQVDLYDDQLWRTLVAAHRAAGNGAGAARAEERYRQVLDELEVEVESAR